MPDNKRYPHHAMRAGPHTLVDGVDLGRAMLPNDIFVALKRVADLDDDEILAAIADGAAHLAALPADAAPGERMGMSPAEAQAAAEAAADITRSRLKAWRKRHRQMTWDELRVLLRGLAVGDPSV